MYLHRVHIIFIITDGSNKTLKLNLSGLWSENENYTRAAKLPKVIIRII